MHPALSVDSDSHGNDDRPVALIVEDVKVNRVILGKLLETTGIIRKGHGKNGDTPTIFVTANISMGTMSKCLESGGNGLLYKPIEKKTLMVELS